MGYTIQRHLLQKNDLWLLARESLPALPDFARAESVYRGEHTRIWRHPDHPGLVSKVALLQTVPRDVLRKYGYYQAKREYRAHRCLTDLGLATPSVFGHGVTLKPWSRPESILFMEALPPHRALRFILREGGESSDRRMVLLEQVAAQLAVIYRSGFHHKDLHFENVLCTADGGLIWIDNDLRYSRVFRTARSRFSAALEQLYETSRRYLSSAEWRAFTATLAGHLHTSDLGSRLASTVIPDFQRRNTSS